MMAICLNNNHLLIGHENLIIFNISSQEAKEINLEHTLLINQEEKKSLGIKEESFIQNITYNRNRHQYLITTDNKGVFILNDNFENVRSFLAKRAISKAAFDHENNVLIADKTGDVYIHKIDGDPDCLLGHLSMLLDIKISANGRYIVTSDRDEKIRVSMYPNAYNIECFCLGHAEYVSNIELWRDLIISGSGDGTIRAWNIESGKQKAIVNTIDNIDNSNGVLKEFKKNMSEDDTFVSCLPITNLQIVQLNEQKIIVTASIYMLNNCNYVDKFIDTYQTIFKKLKRKDVKVLYKKTFDNVQDYLDRKKMRIDLKNQ